jgi:phage tail sheath protein FI
MADPIFGVKFIDDNLEPRPAIPADMSTVGIIGPAADADPLVFPLNTPVALYSNDIVMLAKLGEAGFIADAIRGVNDQLGQLQRAAQIIVVRTAPGVNADPALALQSTIANIMGSSTADTGLWSFLEAPSICNATPRIIIAPGYTAQLATGVASLATTPGAGYAPVGDVRTLTFTGGGTSAVQATGTAKVQPDGTLGEFTLTSPGAWYTAPPTVAISGAAGTTPATVTATTDTLANPIVATMEPVLQQLLAHGIAESAGTSQASDIAWRETVSAGRVIGFVGGVKVQDPVTGNIVVMPRAGREAGLLVQRDFENGHPFGSAANRPLQGIVGPARTLRFALTDGANEGQALLAANLGIIARGEVGNDFAIASGGFVSIATDNLGDDELWRFYNQMRGRDYIKLMLLRQTRYYLGKFNITPQAIQAIVNGQKQFLRDLQADEAILGYKVYFNGRQNSADEIRKGNITIAFAAEEPPVLRKVTEHSARYRPAIDAMVAQLEATLNLAA